MTMGAAAALGSAMVAPLALNGFGWQGALLMLCLLYTSQELQLSSKLAVHDVLTNIYNRRYFFNSVESLLSRPVVKDFCVMLLSLIHI